MRSMQEKNKKIKGVIRLNYKLRKAEGTGHEAFEKYDVDVDCVEANLEPMGSCRKGSSASGVGLLVVASMPVGGSAGCAIGGGAGFGRVIGYIGRGEAHVGANLRSRSRLHSGGRYLALL